MSFVLDAFQVFLQNISLPDSQLASAQRSNSALRRFLANDDYFGRLTLDTFLNGSYARHTAVQPIKDVDVIVVVDTDWMQADPSRAIARRPRSPIANPRQRAAALDQDPPEGPDVPREGPRRSDQRQLLATGPSVQGVGSREGGCTRSTWFICARKCRLPRDDREPAQFRRRTRPGVRRTPRRAVLVGLWAQCIPAVVGRAAGKGPGDARHQCCRALGRVSGGPVQGEVESGPGAPRGRPAQSPGRYRDTTLG